MQKTSKNAIITGGARRLGGEISLALAQNGWNVAIHHNTTSPAKLLSDISNLGVKAVGLQADLLNHEEVSKLVSRAAKELGEITLLVNSASIFEHIRFRESDENAYDAHMDIHVKAPFFLSQEFAFQCHQGQIINIIDSSVTSNDGGHFAYFLAKKSLRELTHMLAKDLAPSIQVNAVFPGAVEEFSNNVSQEFLSQRMNKLPMKKLATAKDITDAVVLLANSSLTGQEVFVDGGEHLI